MRNNPYCYGENLLCVCNPQEQSKTETKFLKFLLFSKVAKQTTKQNILQSFEMI